jgi:hypothetical protein
MRSGVVAVPNVPPGVPFGSARPARSTGRCGRRDGILERWPLRTLAARVKQECQPPTGDSVKRPRRTIVRVSKGARCGGAPVTKPKRRETCDERLPGRQPLSTSTCPLNEPVVAVLEFQPMLMYIALALSGIVAVSRLVLLWALSD